MNGRPLAEFIGDFPFDDTDKAALLALHEEKTDYLHGMTREQKDAWMESNSYTTFLRDKVGLSERAITFFQQRTDDFQAVASMPPPAPTPACAPCRALPAWISPRSMLNPRPSWTTPTSSTSRMATPASPA